MKIFESPLTGRRFALSSLAAIILSFLFPLTGLAQPPPTRATLRVTAHDASARPVASVLAQLKLKGTAASTAPTNEQGEAEFTNLAPGIYELMVS